MPKNTTTPSTATAVRRFDLKQVAEITGLTVSALETMRHEGRGPETYKLGNKVVCEEPALVAWIEEQKAATVRGGVR